MFYYLDSCAGAIWIGGEWELAELNILTHESSRKLHKQNTSLLLLFAKHV